MHSSKDIYYGILAGMLAAGMLSLLMPGPGPLLQPGSVTLLIGVVRAILEGSGLPAPFAGWLWFYAIGGLWWGAWFAVMLPLLPGCTYLAKGASFGILAGLLVIWTILPLAAALAPEMKPAQWQPLVTVFEHLLYGLALGRIYGWLKKS